VDDAVKQLPEHVKQYLDNTTIAVEPFPSNDDLTAQLPPLSPTILGVFRGTPVGERSVSNAFDHVTAAIVLYQRNLERFARTRDELIEQIGITLMHEVGHLIGLDEEDLWERGLD
jgi:predicted Zn-dependent protease with MMP-like domain